MEAKFNGEVHSEIRTNQEWMGSQSDRLYDVNFLILKADSDTSSNLIKWRVI